MTRTGLIALAMLVALLVSICFYFLFEQKGPDPLSLPATEQGDSDSSADSPGAVGEGENKKERIEAGGDPNPVDTGSADSAASSVITGTVLDRASNTPVKDALLFIGLDVPAVNAAAAGWIDSLRSGEDGRFAFDGLSHIPHRIRAVAPGRLFAEIRNVFPGEDKEVLLAADSGIPCELKVEGLDGSEPLPLQEISLEAHGEAWALNTKTDHMGAFSITGIDSGRLESADNNWDLRIVVPGYMNPVLELVSDTQEQSYTITVERGTTVLGQVVDKADGSAIAGAVVFADSGHSVTTDERGCYTITGVFDTLCADAPGYAMAAEELVDVPGGIEFEDVRVTFELERGLTLYGRVTDTDLRPIPGVRVGVAGFSLDLAVDDQRLERNLLQEYGSITDSDGCYRIEELSAQVTDLPGIIELEVRPPGWQGGTEEDVRLKNARGEVEHNIILQLSSRFSGAVLGVNGEPLQAASVILQGVGDGQYQMSMTDERGEFQFSNLLFGPYHAVVLVRDNPVLIQAIEIPSSHLTFRVQPHQEVTGTVVRQTDGAPIPGLLTQLVYCFGVMTFDEKTVTDEEGRFAFDNVPPGNLSLYFTQHGDVPLYAPLPRRHRELIEVEQGPWIGVVEYRERPSGWAEFEFAVAKPDGKFQAPEGLTEVWLSTFRFSRASKLGQSKRFENRLLPGFVAGEGGEKLLGKGKEGFRVFLRQGDYMLRFVLQTGTTEIVRDVSITVKREEVVKHRVIF